MSVTVVISRKKQGCRDHATRFFGLLSIELWMQIFIDQPVTQQKVTYENFDAS